MTVLPFPPRVDSADDMEASVAEAQDMLARASEVPAMQHDPFRLILGGLSAALGALVKTTRRWEMATGNVVSAAAGVEAARQPFPQEERDALVRTVTDASREAVGKAARSEARVMIRAFDHKVAMLVGASVAGAFVLGILLDQAVTYARAPSYDVIRLAGNALLCRGDGVKVDADGVRYAPVIKAALEPGTHR